MYLLLNFGLHLLWMRFSAFPVVNTNFQFSQICTPRKRIYAFWLWTVLWDPLQLDLRFLIQGILLTVGFFLIETDVISKRHENSWWGYPFPGSIPILCCSQENRIFCFFYWVLLHISYSRQPNVVSLIHPGLELIW